MNTENKRFESQAADSQISHDENLVNACAELKAKLGLEPSAQSIAMSLYGMVLDNLYSSFPPKDAERYAATLNVADLIRFTRLCSLFELNPFTGECLPWFNADMCRLEPNITYEGSIRISNAIGLCSGYEFIDGPLASADLDYIKVSRDLDSGEYIRTPEQAPQVEYLKSVTCRYYRKDMERPCEATVYFDEFYQPVECWAQRPKHCLRRKAFTMAVRQAYGLGACSAEALQELAQRGKEFTQALLNTRKAVTTAATANSGTLEDNMAECRAGSVNKAKSTAAAEQEHVALTEYEALNQEIEQAQERPDDLSHDDLYSSFSDLLSDFEEGKLEGEWDKLPCSIEDAHQEELSSIFYRKTYREIEQRIGSSEDSQALDLIAEQIDKLKLQLSPRQRRELKLQCKLRAAAIKSRAA